MGRVLLVLLMISLIAVSSAGAFEPSQWRPRLEHQQVAHSFIAIGADAELVEKSGGRVRAELRLIGGVAFEGGPKTVKALAERGARVHPDRLMRLIEPIAMEARHSPLLAHAVVAIGAPRAWELGYIGSDVRVAVIDTGIENMHPWLLRGNESVVKWEYDATGSGQADYCTAFLGPSVHGTHVAGIIASQHPTYSGVAPGADLYDIIVFSAALDCVVARESDVIAGIEAALLGPDGRAATGDEAHILSLSLGVYATPERQAAILAGRLESPIIAAIEKAVRAGKIVVVAAGNAFSMNVVNELCLAGGVICVGATSHMGTDGAEDDMMAWFSSKGPGPIGRPIPHLVAPGTLIYSAVPTILQEMYGLEEPAAHLSGTSMATPMVSGAVAVLLSQRSSLRGEEALAILASTARDVKPQRPDFFWLYPELVEIIEVFMPQPKMVTVADQGAGQLNLSLAAAAEAMLFVNGKPIGHVIAERGAKLIIEAAAFKDAVLRLKELRLVEVYALRDESHLIKVEPREISLTAGGRAAIEIPLPDLQPGVYGGYAIFESRASGAQYRAPFVLFYPLNISSGALFEIETMLGSRDIFDIIIYYARADARRGETIHVSIGTISSQYSMLDVFQSLIIAPNGVAWQGSSVPVSQRGLYAIAAFALASYGIPKEVKSSIAVSVGAGEAVVEMEQRIARILSELSSLSSRLAAAESRLAAIAANLTALSLKLEAQSALTQREIAVLSRSISALNASMGAVSRDLAALRSRLEEVSASLSIKSKELEEGLAAAQRRLASAEALLSTISMSLERLSSELKDLERESVEMKKDHSLTRLIAALAVLLGALGLVGLAYQRLTGRSRGL